MFFEAGSSVGIVVGSGMAVGSDILVGAAVGVAGEPQAARTMEAITSKLRIKGNLLVIFLSFLNLNGRVRNAERLYLGTS